MTPFFRKIRKQLADDNPPVGRASRPLKYLRYALGEIVLVVIGILIALQVNTYSKNVQDRKLEMYLLKEFKTSIINDTIGIKENLDNFIKIEEYAHYLDSMVVNRRPYTGKIDTAFGVISAFYISESNYVVFDKAKSYKTGLIKNDRLFTLLSNYYNNSKSLSEVDKYFHVAAYFRRDIYPKYFKGYKFSRLAVVSDYEKILNSDEIKVAIDYCINDAKFYKKLTQLRKEQARELIELLNTELKRFEK